MTKLDNLIDWSYCVQFILVVNSLRGRNTYRTWENFGELMALMSLARKNLANLLVVY